MSKILFILKRREDFNAVTHSAVGLSTGLYNSASFVNDMLESIAEYGIRAKMVVVRDNNDIDREVTLYKPTHVIIEALWVVPTKFDILQKLHPTVEWIVRLHSEMPFMAGEGMAMDWIGEYTKFKNVKVGINAPRMMREVGIMLKAMNSFDEDYQPSDDLIYLPNYYPQHYIKKPFDKKKEYVDVGCFGAIRPLKNQLLQAIAAIDFANHIGKKLRFHINAGRTEMKGESNYHNLQGLFQHLADAGHQLVNHTWVPREQFLEVCAQMDIGMQVSFSETFNIVGCDLISQGVPIVATGKEIPWLSRMSWADPNESHDITLKLIRAYNFPQVNVALNKYKLTRYTNKTKNIWLNYFKEKQ